MEQNSGVTFREAEVALARQWIGDDSNGSQKEVTFTLPEATTEGIVVSDKTPAKTVTVPIPESEEAARQVIERFEDGADSIRGDDEVSDTVSQHMLQDSTSLLDEKWLGTKEEELDACVEYP
jgi:phospholipase D1/2